MSISFYIFPRFNLSLPPNIDFPLSNLDTWGRVYFVHFLDILNTSPNVQNFNIHCYLSLHLFSLLNYSLALAIFFKILLFADIFSPALLFHLPNIRPFIDISLFNLDTWGRVYFVHFLDILNTSPSVQIGNIKLKALWTVGSRIYLNKMGLG